MAIENLKCKECGATYDLGAHFACENCFGPLEVAYDYSALDPAETKRKIDGRKHTARTRSAHSAEHARQRRERTRTRRAVHQPARRCHRLPRRRHEIADARRELEALKKS